MTRTSGAPKASYENERDDDEAIGRKPPTRMHKPVGDTSIAGAVKELHRQHPHKHHDRGPHHTEKLRG